VPIKVSWGIRILGVGRVRIAQAPTGENPTHWWPRERWPLVQRVCSWCDGRVGWVGPEHPGEITRISHLWHTHVAVGVVTHTTRHSTRCFLRARFAAVNARSGLLLSPALAPESLLVHVLLLLVDMSFTRTTDTHQAGRWWCCAGGAGVHVPNGATQSE
jgi:hypothetical protein